MRAFIASCVAVVVISLVTALILSQLGWDSAAVHSTANVRL